MREDFNIDNEIKDEELIYSKSPTIPFAPLHREIGVSYVEGMEYRDLTEKRQKIIFDWVSDISQPFDMVQRAEGWSSPEKVYYGAGNRALRHNESSLKDKAILRAEAGRAALRRHYRVTYDHYDIANDRFLAGKTIMNNITKYNQIDHEDASNLEEILQELANGVAANFDNLFPGGDEYARIAGHSILRVIDTIAVEGGWSNYYTTLASSGVNYVGKQADGWVKALKFTENFAQTKDFALNRDYPEI